MSASSDSDGAGGGAFPPTERAPAGIFAIAGDMPVHRMGYGAMRITGPGIWGEPDDPDAARALLRRAHELGVDLVDTADAYGPEVSERLIAQALHPYPEGFVVATKGGSVRPGPNQWVLNGNPDHLKRACEESALRLRVDTIDLYQLHAVDPKVPLAESVGALKELQDEGKIRHIGLSNVKLDQLEEARGIVEVVSVQNRYSYSDRGSEDVLRACEAHGIAFLPYFPLAAGKLAKPGGALDQVAKNHGATTAGVAIAWLLEHSPNIIPIPGTSSAAHLEENMRRGTLDLSDDDIAALDAASEAG